MSENGKNETATSSEAEVLKDAVLEGAAEEVAAEKEATAAEAGAPADAEASEDAAPSPEERSKRLGEALAAAQAEEAQQAAEPAAQARDRKAHVGIIVAVVAFAVLLVGAGVAYNMLAPQTEHEVEVTGTDAVHSTEADAGDDAGEGNGANATTPAPDFPMTDASGKELNLNDLKGRPILLNFWASWCGPCKSEMPAIQDAYERYGSDVQFVIVNMTGMSGETEALAKSFLEEGGYTFPAYFDADNSAAAAYGVNSIPQTYLVNSQGDIIGAYLGAMDESILGQGMDMLLADAQ